MAIINETFTALADAIRSKTGSTAKMSISDMTTAVLNLSVSGAGLSLQDVVSTDTTLEGSLYKENDTIKSFTGNSVTKVNSAVFRDCKYLESVSLPNALTSIGGYAFSGCRLLTTLDIGSVSSIVRFAFKDCSSLGSLTLNGCSIVSDYACMNCTSLYSFTASSATTVGDYAFQNCSSLTTVSLPICEGIGAGAFLGNASLTSLTLPSVTYIDACAFSGCISLKTLTLSNTTQMCTLSNINSLPINSSGLVVYVPAELLSQYTANSVWSSLARTTIKAIS